eukprot:1744493-Amphidinium_carterae.2
MRPHHAHAINHKENNSACLDNQGGAAHAETSVHFQYDCIRSVTGAAIVPCLALDITSLT